MAQSNRDSRPHLIGGPRRLCVGNWIIYGLTRQPDWKHGLFAAVSAGAALYTFRQSGTYVYLSHNLIEAVQLGALSHVIVEGDWDDGLMKQTLKPSPMSA